MSPTVPLARRVDRRGLMSGATAAAEAFAMGGPRTASAAPASSPADTVEYVAQPVTYRTTDIDGLTSFYREAGDSAAPTILLLHGFPSSSHMFRNLIPLLAPDFH
jgi:hypothetical protein